MNISPILLFAIGSIFAMAYGLIITIGWAITRKNRRIYHNSLGYSEVEKFDLNDFKPLGTLIKTASLEHNKFINDEDAPIDTKNFKCYIVDNPSPEYPKIQKGDLILIEPESNKIKYAFKIPDLKNFR